MNILLLGSNGMLGSMLHFLLKTKYSLPFLSLSKSDFDVLNDEIYKLDNYISSPDTVIINCIGAIPQKKYSDEDYKLINISFPLKLSTYCKFKNIKLIHISTNCVFSGIKDNCMESDKADATDIYGISKLEGEPDYGLVLRCSIIGPEKHTFCGLMEWFLNNKASEINGFTDHFWNGLTTLELSKIILDFVENKNINSTLLHLFSENTLSKYEIVQYINKVFHTNITINKKEFGTKYYTLSSNFTQPRKSIYDQIDELFTIFNNYKEFYNLK
jgi:dTDP-4-dehydrorhamnose reductase